MRCSDKDNRSDEFDRIQSERISVGVRGRQRRAPVVGIFWDKYREEKVEYHIAQFTNCSNTSFSYILVIIHFIHSSADALQANAVTNYANWQCRVLDSHRAFSRRHYICVRHR